MERKKENKKNDKVEEPRVEYEVQKPKIKGIDRETFDFDAEFANGFTLEQAKAESIRGIENGGEKTIVRIKNSEVLQKLLILILHLIKV